MATTDQYEVLKMSENNKFTLAGEVLPTVWASFMVGKRGPFTVEVPKTDNWNIALRQAIEQTVRDVTAI